VGRPATGAGRSAKNPAEPDARGSSGRRRDSSGIDALLKVLGSAGADGTAVRVRVAVVHDGTAPPPAGLHPDEVFLLAFSAGVPEIMTHVQRIGAGEVYLSPWTPPVVGRCCGIWASPASHGSGRPNSSDLEE